MLLSALRMMTFVLPLLLESCVMKKTHVFISDVHTQQTKQSIDRLCID